MSGPGIKPGEQIYGANLLDITPTVLTLLGLPVAKDMDGKAARFVATPRLTRIATYDTHSVHHITAVPSGAEEEMLDRLRALGYFEEN